MILLSLNLYLLLSQYSIRKVIRIQPACEDRIIPKYINIKGITPIPFTVYSIFYIATIAALPTNRAANIADKMK